MGRSAEVCSEKNQYIRGVSPNKLDDDYKIETSSILAGEPNFIQADPPSSTCSAPSQSDSAHGVFWKRGKKSAVRLMDIVMRHGAHGHKFCSDVISRH